VADVWEYSTVTVERVGRRQRLHEILVRVCDIVLASLLIAFLSPLLAVAALLTWSHDGGSPIFAHTRIGRDGQSFKCLKFRSMVVDSAERLAALLASSPAARAEWEKDHKLRNDPRITPWGGFMRKTSIDELPQLFNVLRGEMSLVGPRPIVAAEVERYGRYISSYYAVTPGITGLWQVSGRNNTTYRRRVCLDVAYARSFSIGLYFKILFATIPAVLLSRGAY